VIATTSVRATIATMNDDHAAAVLGSLYALAAAVINDDADAVVLLATELTPAQRLDLPEAAVAVAASCISNTSDGDDPFSDPDMASVHPSLRRAIDVVLTGEHPGPITFDTHDDVIEASVRAVAQTWLWMTGGDAQSAAVIARQHCARLIRYRER
jgi:hypothetical protein